MSPVVCVSTSMLLSVEPYLKGTTRSKMDRLSLEINPKYPPQFGSTAMIVLQNHVLVVVLRDIEFLFPLQEHDVR